MLFLQHLKSSTGQCEGFASTNLLQETFIGGFEVLEPDRGLQRLIQPVFLVRRLQKFLAVLHPEMSCEQNKTVVLNFFFF